MNSAPHSKDFLREMFPLFAHPKGDLFSCEVGFILYMLFSVVLYI